MKKVGFAIVGCGNIVANHLSGILGTPEAELIAVVDIVEAKAKAVAEKHKVKYYTDIKDMLRNKDVDVVTICLPSGIHMENSILAMEAGKHVISEKPLEVNLEKIDKMIEASKRTKKHLEGIFQSRFYESSLIIRKSIQDGKLGKLVLGDAYNKWYRSPEYYASAGWRATWDLDGGGALMNQAIHALDLLMFFMGEVEAVTAYCETIIHKIPVEDTAIAILKFKNGALGTIEATTSINPGEERKLEIHGSKGTIILNGFQDVTWKMVGQPEKKEGAAVAGGASDPLAVYHGGHLAQFKAFTRALLAGEVPPVPASEARKAVELILAIYKSSREKKEIRLPL